jgi:hypothetical protein
MVSRADASTAMPDTDSEREQLGKADRDIVEGEERITRQMVLIETMRLDGHDVTEAENLLLTLRETLAAWQAHREEILRELARQEAMRPR